MFSSNRLLLLFVFGTFFLTACQRDNNNWELDQLDTRLEEALETASNGKGLSYYILPESDDYQAIPQDPNNPISKDKVKLGRLLFHETGIAINPKNPNGEGTYSCASCHHAQGGFQACLPQGIGDGGKGFGMTGELRAKDSAYAAEDVDVQPIRTPSALNIAYQKNVLWNGQFGATGLNRSTESEWTSGTPKETNHLGFEGTETQAIAGLKVHRLVVDSGFIPNNGHYVALFDRAFDYLEPQERISQTNAGLAIAAYERTLLANKAPFQEWLKGDNKAMSESEKLGALLFFTKGQCNNCHNGPALSSMEFHALGMNDLHDGSYGEIVRADPEDGAHLGRGGFTGRDADMYKFKVPQLYNLKNSPFYGHGASFRSVEEVVKYKNEAVAENPDVPASQLSKHFQPLLLSDTEMEHISNFIENALNDPDLERYVPTSVPSGNCFPNNDGASKDDLGCS